ncbi:MAG: hypothetical protein Q4A00_07430 [Flavobacteriaceae bacterium]|nr:hypothetical protein [Flavobacteriaceae bacterium]
MIQDLISHYRNRLNALEDAILIGEIPEGATKLNTEIENLVTEEHKNFLKICDGGFFGDVVLWRTSDILESQYKFLKMLKIQCMKSDKYFMSLFLWIKLQEMYILMQKNTKIC